ncbi:MAG: class I SAM-dependent methyltransferase [Polyangiaceae bacterium]
MTPPAETSAYDRVAYDTRANPDAHPRSLAAMLALHGLEPTPVARARVLDVGCGTGAHLTAAAGYLPDARFVGIDLASSAIAAGRSHASRSGLTNVDLQVRDLASFDVRAEHPEGFDVATADGMLSWLPPALRERLFATLAAALVPGGVAFVSFNRMPGWNGRRSLRALARERVRSSPTADDPERAVAAALEAIRDVAQLFAHGRPPSNPAERLADEARRYLAHVDDVTPEDARFPEYVFHDLLAETNEGLTLAEVDASARAAGLSPVGNVPFAFPVDAEHDLTLPFAQRIYVRRDVVGTVHAPRSPSWTTGRATYVRADWTRFDDDRWTTTDGSSVVAGTPGTRALFEAFAEPPSGATYVRVDDLAESDEATARDLLVLVASGALEFHTEPPPCLLALPREGRVRTSCEVAARVRQAMDEDRDHALLVSAFHRVHRAGRDDLAQLARMERLPDSAEDRRTLGRFARLGFVLPSSDDPRSSAGGDGP